MDPGLGAPRVGTADLVQALVNERHVAKRRLKARARLEVRGSEACNFYQRVINQIGMVFPPFNTAAEELLNRGVWNLNQWLEDVDLELSARRRVIKILKTIVACGGALNV